MSSHAIILSSGLVAIVLLCIFGVIFPGLFDNDSRSSNKALNFLQKSLGFLFIIAVGLFFNYLAFTLKERDSKGVMTPLSNQPNVEAGFVRKITKEGIHIESASVVGKTTLYTPIIQMTEGVNPAFGYSVLRRSRDEESQICFKTASLLRAVSEAHAAPIVAQANVANQIAYNIQPCDSYKDAPSKPSGTYEYLSTLQISTVGTLVGYESGRKKVNFLYSKLDNHKYIIISDRDSTGKFLRSSNYGYPDNKYLTSDIGKRFCIAGHKLAHMKFDKNGNPLGFWNIPQPGIYLWSCEAAGSFESQ